MKTSTDESLSSRLSNLAAAAQAVAAGDLDVRVPETRDDDLGTVGRAFNDMADQLQSTINTLEDMVAQRTADLTESEEKLRLLIEGLKGYAVSMLDTEGRVASWNAGAEQMTGYSEHEVFGLPVSIFYTDEDVEAGKPDWALEMARESGRFEEEGWRVRKDGSQFWAESVISALRDETGELRGFAAVIRDITERNRIQRENSLLLETTRAVSSAKDCDSALTAAVHAICRTTGWAFGEAWVPNKEGRLECALTWHRSDIALAAFHEVGHVAGFAPGEAIAGKTWQSGKPEWDEDISKLDLQLTRRRSLALAAGLHVAFGVPVIDAGDTLAVLTFYIGEMSIHDRLLSELVTSVAQQLGAVIRRRQAGDELAALNEELEQRVQERTLALQESNRELEDFTYVVSHDLKEPLRGIEGFSAFLAEDYGEQIGEEGRRYLDNVRESAIRMKRLIEELLELSRITRVRGERQPVEASALIADVISDLEYSIREKGVELRVQPGLPAVIAEPVRLREVFKNLISNAVKFSDESGGIVEVGSQDADGAVQFFVRDNGIGIDEQYHERIFQIFQRLNRREDYEGTGAGLTICKKIVEAHGGRIWVESAAGEGSTFHFTIPAPQPERGQP
jgi:PAS domain S-box-containing protein